MNAQIEQPVDYVKVRDDDVNNWIETIATGAADMPQDWLRKALRNIYNMGCAHGSIDSLTKVTTNGGW